MANTNSNLSTSIATQNLIKDYEKDPKTGTPILTAKFLNGENGTTIGWGHYQVGGINVGDTITISQAQAWFDSDILTAENYVKSVVTAPLTQQQFDALVMAKFNVSKFGPKMIAALNSGNYEQAAYEWAELRKSEGPEPYKPGTISRRNDEIQLFENGDTTRNYNRNDRVELYKAQYVRLIDEGYTDSVARQKALELSNDAVRNSFSNCFSAGTPIVMSDGSYKAIENVRISDMVQSYDADGNLKSGRVVRLFRNKTDAFIKLQLPGSDALLYVTEGHEFLTKNGKFSPIGKLIQGGTAEVVMIDGTVRSISAERITYSYATAHMFEAAQVMNAVGNLSLKPQYEHAWQTYNFEVEEFHTYVAGDIRVHNDSLVVLPTGLDYQNNPLLEFLEYLGIRDEKEAQLIVDKEAGTGRILWTRIDEGSTAIIDNKEFSIADAFRAAGEASDAVAEFISEQADAKTSWFTGAGPQLSLATWFSNNLAGLIDGTISVDQALIALAKQFGQDFVAGFVNSQVTDVASANNVLTQAFTALGAENPAIYAGAIQNALARIATDFVGNGFNVQQTLDAGKGVLASAVTLAVLESQGWSLATTPAGIAAVTVAVSGLINSGSYTGADWGRLGVQIAVAAAAAEGGAAIATILVNPGTYTNPVTIVAAAVIAIFGSKLLGGLFGRGKYYNAGEFPSMAALQNSIYQVQTITVDGQQVPALVAVSPQGSTILVSGTNIGYVIGNVGADVLVGTDAVQTINGNAGADYLEARGGNDNLLGGDGNDHLNGGDGADILQGDGGGDIILAEAGADTVLGGTGDDFMHLGSSDDIAAGGEGNDYILASGGNDAASGDAGDDTIDGGYGDDSIDGGDGNDLILGNLGNDYINGAYGSDTIFGDAGNDQINGGNGNDFIDGGDGIDILNGEAGRDMIVGGAGDDFADGGIGDDNVIGGIGNDVLLGGLDNDYLKGEDGNDTLIGGIGNDILAGGVGANSLQGNEGNDVYVISSDPLEQNNIIIEDGGAADTDTILLSWLASPAAQTGVNLLKNGNDLTVSYAGRTLATITDQFVAGHAVEKIELAGGNYIDLSTATYNPTTNVGTFTVTPSSSGSVYADVAKREAEVNDNLIAKDSYWNNTFLSKLSQIAYDEQLQEQTVYKYYDGTEFEAYKRSQGKFGGKYSIYKLATPGNIDGTDSKLEYVVQDAEDQAAANSFGNNIAGMSGPYESLINGAQIIYSTVSGHNVQDIVIGGSVVSTKVAGESTVYAAGGSVYGATYAQRLATGTSAISDVAVKKFGTDLLVGAYWDETINGKSGDDVIVGNDGNDNLIGGDGNDWGFGGDGIDTLAGGNGDDVLFGGAGNDNISGGANDDAILGGDGNDSVAGDAGNDWIDGGAGNDTLNAGDGDDLILGGVGDDSLDGGVGNDVIRGGNGNDILVGGDGDDTLIGGSGSDSVYGGAGNDVINGDGGVIFIDGGDGRDLIVFNNALSGITLNLAGGGGLTVSNFEEVIATEFNDSITGGAQSESLSGMNGNDTLIGAAGADTLSGGAGNDSLSGGNDDDTLIGGAGSDLLDGGLGSDTASYSGSGAAVTLNLATNSASGGDAQGDVISGIESLIGSAYSDVLTGDTNNNSFVGLLGADTIDGGAGSDTVGYTASQTAVAVNLNLSTAQSGGEAQGDILLNIESVLASAYNDTLTGNALSNLLQGNAGNDTIIGGIGADTLDGGSGNDSMTGGVDNDTYAVDAIGDVVVENASEGTDTVLSSITYTLGTNLENLTLTGTAAIDGTGNAFNNVLIGNAGNNILNGAVGNDSMSGGLGNDTYMVDVLTDVVTENASEGTDTVVTALNYTLGSNLENLTLTGSTAVNGTGNALDNVLIGNSGNNTLDGGAGNDSLIGGLGNDTYFVDSSSDVITENAAEGTDSVSSTASYILSNNLENLTLTGAIAANGTGNALNNSITGNAADNILDGGAGIDTLAGGLGNDTYLIDSATDLITENASAGTDTVISSVTYTLAANLENLTLAGSGNASMAASSVALFDSGYTLDTTSGVQASIQAQSSADSLTQDSYASTPLRMARTPDAPVAAIAYGIAPTELDSVFITSAAAPLLAMATSDAAINGTGNALNNVIIGNAANNVLDGGTGNDSLTGGLGDDTYVIDVLTDVITENANEGMDTVISAVTYTLSSNLENLTLSGSAVINGTGNSNDNVIIGNTAVNILDGGLGNDTLDGGAGSDSLRGGQGNDAYIVDSTSDVIVENVGEGVDSVSSSASYTLSANIENLTLTGTAVLSGTGNDLNNVITGNSNDNVIDGGLGNDTMIGGLGNDTYKVDSVGDVIVENANEGTGDSVNSSITYTLGTTLERLTLTGAAAINGTGNALDNILYGNTANNILNGGDGADQLNGFQGIDTLIGGAGDDTYVVADTGDVITENTNEGYDRVWSEAANYTLSANIEDLWLSGAGINATGNALNNSIIGTSAANTLTGGAGNDTLDGGLGIDSLVGGLGDDIYYVDVTGDRITENANEGTDTVYSAVTYTLSGNIENLILSGVASVNGTGDSGNNVITGNQGVNLLTGNAGNDSLYGGLSNDTLQGGDGNDWLDGGRGTDSIDGGLGVDTLSYAGSLTGVSVNFGNGAFTGGDAVNDVVTNVENLFGSSFNDSLTGNTLANAISGGSGVDTMAGGTGADSFAYFAVTDSGKGLGNRDIITDFTKAQSDKIDLSAFAGTFAFLGTGAFTGGVTPQVRYVTEGANTIVQVNTNNDTIADFEIQVNGLVAFVSTDFVL